MASEWAKRRLSEMNDWTTYGTRGEEIADALDAARAVGKAEADAEKFAEGFRAGMEEAGRLAFVKSSHVSPNSRDTLRVLANELRNTANQLPTKGQTP